MNNTKTIYLAGGCFWGIEAYFSNLWGIFRTEVGYINGKIDNPTYEEVCSGQSGFAEALKIEYDPNIISLKDLLYHFFEIIDPTSYNCQGNDCGNQYRSGIYYKDQNDKEIIESVLKEISNLYHKPIATEVMNMVNYYPAEDYHQKYLEKNPHGYCHINLDKVKKYKKPDKDKLRQILDRSTYAITQEGATEPPFSSEFNKHFEKGIYVDTISGEPLFSSNDKMECQCGWPSFTKPIEAYALKEKEDYSHSMVRTEVKSRYSDSHLGHVFNEPSGKRYCINGKALRFVQKDDLEKEGYGEYLRLFFNY